MLGRWKREHLLGHCGELVDGIEELGDLSEESKPSSVMAGFDGWGGICGLWVATGDLPVGTTGVKQG